MTDGPRSRTLQPGSSFSFVTDPSPCEYLPEQVWQLRYEVDPRLTADRFAGRLARGWRRFGPAMFRPECPRCNRCQPLRVPVASFRPSDGQRRAWKANAGTTALAIGAPTASPAHRRIYEKYHRHQHHAKGWPLPDRDGADTFLDNPFATEEWRYTIDGRLIGVGYVDRVPQALSAIYFYYDPDERARSLGTYNVLAILARARALGVPHVYLGFYVEGCRSLAYKAAFQPNEVMTPEGAWMRFRQRA